MKINPRLRRYLVSRPTLLEYTFIPIGCVVNIWLLLILPTLDGPIPYRWGLLAGTVATWGMMVVARKYLRDEHE